MSISQYILTVNILDDMLAGVGWTMHDYVHYCKNDYYPPLPNGHRLFVHDNRRVAVRAAIAMAEKGDIVVSCSFSLFNLQPILGASFFCIVVSLCV